MFINQKTLRVDSVYNLYRYWQRSKRQSQKDQYLETLTLITPQGSKKNISII